jgi:extracellular elastinolytic metalloproteinase
MRTTFRRGSGAAIAIAVTAALLVVGGAQGAPSANALEKRLLAKGHSHAIVDGLKVTATYSGLHGIRHVRLQQRVDGLDVYGAGVRAALAPDGSVVALIDGLADASGTVAPASVDAAAAVRAAGGGTATAVAIASGGRYAQGYVVETWGADGLRYTLVDGKGRVVSVENRTANDSYNVFTEDPFKTPQTVMPGQPGWLGAGTQSSHHISGNNVDAYLDTDDDNAADAGGTTVTDGNFLTAADLAVSPGTDANQSVSVQNLFYLNNVVHDVLYSHGFTEAAGNFEAEDGDAVQAEAQDGGGLDNANFSTPTDGTPPRMQMYLWSPVQPDAAVDTSFGTLDAVAAGFGKALTETGVTDDVANAVPADGCTTISGVSGQIALIDRGTCDFTLKVKNAQRAGATGVIVANNVATAPFAMGGSAGGLKISAVMISQADGAALRAALPQTVTMRGVPVTAPQIDGSLDSDIVFHEYGHGLTWRMIGGMSGPLAGAIGEGASDTLAMLINGDDRVGEYAFSDPLGIRTEPYTDYTRTYGDVAGTEVHFDGEVYAAIGWRMIETFPDRSHLFDLWVDGMNYTPSTPSFEDMRDGMLQSATNTVDECLIWNAFADYGVGVGATHVIRGKKVNVTESFAVPAEC